MGMTYLWDTNIAIYFLQQQFPPEVEIVVDNLVKREKPVISAITEIELLCWKTSNEEDLRILQNFINETIVIELEKDIKLITADIRKNYRIKLPDAIIAASAIVYQLSLITHNYKDFENIKGLKIIDPFNT
ncbi:MAG: type II toxin-antitoxin system VapC family toxin [Dyadobacter sp.]